MSPLHTNRRPCQEVGLSQSGHLHLLAGVFRSQFIALLSRTSGWIRTHAHLKLLQRRVYEFVDEDDSLLVLMIFHQMWGVFEGFNNQLTRQWKESVEKHSEKLRSEGKQELAVQVAALVHLPPSEGVVHRLLKRADFGIFDHNTKSMFTLSEIPCDHPKGLQRAVLLMLEGLRHLSAHGPGRMIEQTMDCRLLRQQFRFLDPSSLTFSFRLTLICNQFGHSTCFASENHAQTHNDSRYVFFHSEICMPGFAESFLSGDRSCVRGIHFILCWLI